MKTILSVLRSPEDAERVLDQAIVLGRNFGSYLVGFHCEALPGAYAAPIGFPSAELFQANQEAESQRTDAIRAVFDRRLREAGLEGEFRFTASFSGDSAVSALSSAYASDIVIAGQIDPDTARADVADLDRLLFDSGRPVILVPYAGSTPEQGVQRILIGWDGSREAARAAFDALPLIQQATHTEILMVDPDEVDGGLASGKQIVAALRRHGARVGLESLPSAGIDTGVVIQNRLSDIGADLLVIGAYNHSRLRQYLFGGVTRRLLTSMPTPTLLSR